MDRPEASKGISSVLNTLQVLEAVARQQPVGVSELARATGMPKSSVHRCLLTLREAGWLRIVDPDRVLWGVTSKPLDIGLTGSGEQSLREVAQPHLEALRDVTNETVHLVIRDGDSLVIILREDCRQAVRTFVEIGTRAPMHATSCGLAVLAKLDDPEVDALLGRGLDTYTDSTPTSLSRLHREIEHTRERGYSVNDSSWWRPDVSAIGAAIVNSAGRPIGALAISVPSSRFAPEDVAGYGAHAVKTAEAIAESLTGR
ncbi:IclR family transcriptional regulator [Pseudonocardia kujensis]|uniref:IclR family transcriptional regulator n=1 Tax=Pseudonocardia kujensis TaxID=1128675 RepID=UPI001E4D5949|nr:IclR family transcriptional regulator [Pseudonocardia kujensis]MCE0763232.1 IclR family transcriptional regulator [Pseudonocardia kujensis]